MQILETDHSEPKAIMKDSFSEFCYKSSFLWFFASFQFANDARHRFSAR